MEIVIRQMQISDIGAVLEIDSECFHVSPDPVMFESMIREFGGRPSRLPVVALNEEGAIVGYAHWSFAEDSKMRLEAVCVKDGYRRQGVGSFLMKVVMTQLRRARKMTLTCLIHDEKLDVLNFLKDHGFVMKAASDNVYRAKYVVPMDNLSDKHIASIAEACRKRQKDIQ